MIHIANLVKKYGEVSAVNDISLDVQACEIFAFLGPNGAGKTPTIKMLTTLLRPRGGSILILGLDPQTRNQLWTQVKALNEQEGVTVFLTTHYMEEAERVAQRIGIIDHGRIVAQGTAAELKQQTGTDSLEQAFLKLTGTSIRSEGATSADAMRAMAAMW